MQIQFSPPLARQSCLFSLCLFLLLLQSGVKINEWGKMEENLNDYLAVTLSANSCLHGFTQHKNLSRKREPMFCLVQSNSSTIFGQSLEGHRPSGFETSREYFSFKNMTRTSTTTTSIPLFTRYSRSLQVWTRRFFRPNS